MANTYTFTGPGERFAEGDPTAEDYMNVSRENTDHLHEALNTIMNTDNITAGTPPDLTIGFGTSMTPPSAVKTAENAQKIIPVMLDDPMQVWNLQAALQDARNQSWWSEGAPPTHGLLFIHENQNSITWWNLDTDAQYIQIDGAANGIIDDATPVLTDIAFLDFRIYLSGTGGADVTIIDLLRDSSYRYSTAGIEQFDATLGDFTGTDGYTVLSTSPATINDSVNSVSACRDPSNTDEFSRPKHWWAIVTGGGVSAYSPVADAIYDENNAIDHAGPIDVSPNGTIVYGQLPAAAGAAVLIRESIFTLSADGWEQDYKIKEDEPAPFDIPDEIWNTTFSASGAATLDGAGPDGGPSCLVGSEDGLFLFFLKDSSTISMIGFDADVVTPMMKGDKRGVWPLASVTDYSNNNHDLTNNGAVTFSNGGPAGSYANFVAASSQSLELADHADFGGMSELSVGCWFYRDIDSGGQEGLVTKYQNGADNDSFFLYINPSDFIAWDIDTSVSEKSVVSTGVVNLAQWYYAVGTYDGTTSRLYINGVEINSAAHTGTIDNSTSPVLIGAAESVGGAPENFLDGRIGGAFITASVMTANEVWWEYQRGLRRIQSGVDGNDALTNADVKSVRADQASRHWIITHADDKLTILDQFGVPIAQDAAPAGTIRDACIWMPSGQDTPSYAMATSTRVEFVQQTRRIFN